MIKVLKYPEDEKIIRNICSMTDYTKALNPPCGSKDVIEACAVTKKVRLRRGLRVSYLGPSSPPSR